MSAEKIRRIARAEGIQLWKIAAVAGISESTVTRWLRKLTPEHEKCLLEALSVLTGGGHSGRN